VGTDQEGFGLADICLAGITPGDQQWLSARGVCGAASVP